MREINDLRSENERKIKDFERQMKDYDKQFRDWESDIKKERDLRIATEKVRGISTSYSK